MLEENKRNKALDGLRGLAAVSVIFYHSILHHEVLISGVLIVPIQNLSSARDVLTKIFLFIFNGNNAVLLFFVISGLVLNLSLDKSATDQIAGTTIRFAVRRIFRLYPAMIVCMLAYFVLACLYRIVGAIGFPAPDLWAVVKNATLIQIAWHGPSTTIQAELLAVPFILAFFYLTRFAGRVGGIVPLGYSLLAVSHPGMVFNLPNMSGWLLAFAAGMSIADQRMAGKFRANPAWLVWPALVCFGFLRLFSNFDSTDLSIAEIFAAMLLVEIVCFAPPVSMLHRILLSGSVQLLGKISYSLYLLNVLALLVVWSVVDRFGWYETHALECGLLVGIVVTLISVPCAVISEKYVEQRGITLGFNFIRRFACRKTASALGEPATSERPLPPRRFAQP